MKNVFDTWKCDLGSRDSVPYRPHPNNTRVAWGWAQRSIELVHFNHKLVEAFPEMLVVHPYYSLTSGRRMYSFANDFGLRMYRHQNCWYYLEPGNPIARPFKSRISMRYDGVVVESDMRQPQPWDNVSRRRATINAKFNTTFDKWIERPVFGCAHCAVWARESVYLTPQSMWEMLVSPEPVVSCIFHTQALCKYSLDVAGLRLIMAEMPLERRRGVLRVVRPQYRHAVQTYCEAALGVQS